MELLQTSVTLMLQTLSKCLCVIRRVFRLGPCIAPTEYDSSWVLLGEASKFIKMSEQHVSDVMVTSGYLIVQLHGSPQQVITIAAIDTNNNITITNVRYFQCTIPDDHEVILHVLNGWCQFWCHNSSWSFLLAYILSLGCVKFEYLISSKCLNTVLCVPYVTWF